MWVVCTDLRTYTEKMKILIFPSQNKVVYKELTVFRTVLSHLLVFSAWPLPHPWQYFISLSDPKCTISCRSTTLLPWSKNVKLKMVVSIDYFKSAARETWLPCLSEMVQIDDIFINWNQQCNNQTHSAHGGSSLSATLVLNVRTKSCIRWTIVSYDGT